MCPVCSTKCADNTKVCEICEFEDKLGVVAFWLNEEDAKNWFKTVITPFREKWQEKLLKMFKRKNDILIKYEGASGNVIIPDGIRVIAGHCFFESKIKKVTIPASVEIIGNEETDKIQYDGAFEFCEELESVNFKTGSKLKSIGRYSFHGCEKIKEIKGYPKSVECVMPHAFKLCGSLDIASINAMKSGTNLLAPSWDS